MKPIKHCLGLLLLALATTSQAFERENYRCDETHDGQFLQCYYAGAGLGLSSLRPDVSDSDWALDRSLGLGGQGLLGWQFHRQAFTEISLAYLGAAEISAGTDKDSVYYTGPGVWLGWQAMPPTSPWSAFAKVGLGHLWTGANDGIAEVESQNNVQMLLGVGAQWQLAPQWLMRLDLNSYDRDARQLSLNAIYLWGQPRLAPVVVIPEPEPLPEPEPEPILVFTEEEVCREFGSALQGVNFSFDSAELNAEARARLDRSVAILLANPELNVEAGAHTDGDGTAAYNLALSQRRADAVMAYFIEQGVARNRLSSQGYGASKPIASNDSEEGKALNRRVELQAHPELVCETQVTESWQLPD